MLWVIIAVWTICGLAGAYVADAKGRAGPEGLVLGALLGPLGVLVVALLPTVPASVPPEAEPAKSQPPKPKPRINTSRDDVAMDFVMDLMRRSESDRRSSESRRSPTQ